MRPTTTTAVWPAAGRRRLLAWLRLPYEYCVLYGGLLLFSLVFLAWSAVASVLRPLLPSRAGSRVGRYGNMLVFRGLLAALQATRIFKFDLRALDALRDEGALIIAPNHPSLLDALLVSSRLPHIVSIMKATIRDNLLLGGAARFAAYIRDDCPLSMVREAVGALRDGDQLLMFPEGTRTSQRAGLKFKGGFALIARRAQVPVQTVFIETNSPFLGKGWPLWKKPVFPLVYRVRLGRRFEVHDDVKTVLADLECYYRDSLAARFDAKT